MPLHLVTGNSNNEDNLVYASDYVVELNERFREAFDIARLCLKKVVLRRKKYYDVREIRGHSQCGRASLAL